MRALVISEEFGLDHLRFEDRPRPSPGPGEILVEMTAASLNYRDLMMVAGHYNPRQPLPLVPGSDGVGYVVEVGAGVETPAVGDRVATLFSQSWQSGPPGPSVLTSTLGGPLDGVLRELMVLPASGVVPFGDSLSDVEGATLPCAALTAWSALVTHASLRPGDVVLIQGTGGVALFALQIARMVGARVIITSSSDQKLERAAKLGAWKLINYRDDPDWGRTARRMSPGGGGVDLVIELGGAGTFEQSCQAVRTGGQISLIGVLAGARAPIALTPVLMRALSIRGIFVGSRDGMEAMCRAFTAHEIAPVIDRVFPFEEAKEAFAYLRGARHFGKVCIEF